jgi:hypothetical protein
MLALALRFRGRKRVHNADEVMSARVASGWSRESLLGRHNARAV